MKKIMFLLCLIGLIGACGQGEMNKPPTYTLSIGDIRSEWVGYCNKEGKDCSALMTTYIDMSNDADLGMELSDTSCKWSWSIEGVKIGAIRINTNQWQWADDKLRHMIVWGALCKCVFGNDTDIADCFTTDIYRTELGLTNI